MPGSWRGMLFYDTARKIACSPLFSAEMPEQANAPPFHQLQYPLKPRRPAIIRIRYEWHLLKLCGVTMDADMFSRQFAWFSK